EEVRESVGVVLLEGMAFMRLVTDAIVLGVGPVAVVFGEGGLEQPVIAAVSRLDRAGQAGHLHARRGGMRVEKADDPAATCLRESWLGAQEGKGVGVSSA